MSATLNAPPNFPNRTLAIMDNIAFLKMLDNESIDLIAIDPPFAANETFEGKPKPPITPAEMRAEYALATRHGPTALARYLNDEVVVSKPYAKEYAKLTDIAARARYLDAALAKDPDGVFLTSEATTRVKDDWFWKNVNKEWMKDLKDAGESVQTYNSLIEKGEKPEGDEIPTTRAFTLNAMREVIEAVTACATENEAAYIAEMSVRLLECHRVLKPTGSIYVHCDQHANSYLRMLMDAIFGHKNFRNEIIWNRATSKGTRGPAKTFGTVTDSLLFYAKSKHHVIDIPHIDDGSKDNQFKHADSRGKYRAVTPLYSDAGLHASPIYEWNGHNPEYGWRVSKVNLQKLHEEDRIHYNSSGRPYRKQYIDEYKGTPISCLWNDIPGTRGKEHTGYSTQKPLALYQRIIHASSNPGDVVLDLFAGCATTAVAAELEGRNWLACDMAYRASTMMMRRFYNRGYVLSGMDIDAVREALPLTPARWSTSTASSSARLTSPTTRASPPTPTTVCPPPPPPSAPPSPTHGPVPSRRTR